MAKQKMDRNDTLAKRVSGVDPAYLAKYADTDTSLAGMDEYRIIPRLKVIQSMTDPMLKNRFGEGTVIIRPGDALVWQEEDTPFLFVPQFFFAEFLLFSDRRDKDAPTVLARSFDPTSELAKRARDPDARYEVYEGHEKRKDQDQWKKRFVESLRFPGVIYGDHPLALTPIVLSFERGEFGQGRNFISALRLRRQRVDDRVIQVPLWAQVWALTASLRDRSDRRWFGIDFTAPEDPLISQNDADMMRSAHEELRQLHEQNKLRVDGDEQDADPAEVAAGADM